MCHLEMCRRSLTAALTALLFVIYAQTTIAQSTAIEPCQASPTPQVSAAAKVTSKVSQTAVDANLPNDPGMETLISTYSAKVRELAVVIGTLEGELKKSGVGAASLGNFVSDAMMATARTKGKSAVLAMTNAGGLRKNSISPGILKASDIFELLPFENQLVEVDVNGAQLLRLLTNLTRARDAQSGARIHFRWSADDRPELIGAKLLEGSAERNIDPSALYTIVTIDYLIRVARGNYGLLQEAKNVRPLNITIRDAVMEYVKSEAAAGRPIRPTLDKRFIQVGPGPTNRQTSPND